MATDPHIEKPDDQGEARPLEDEQTTGDEAAERETDSRFQKFVDEAGRRFREALDRLA